LLSVFLGYQRNGRSSVRIITFKVKKNLFFVRILTAPYAGTGYKIISSTAEGLLKQRAVCYTDKGYLWDI
jgi:hypothetical protein